MASLTAAIFVAAALITSGATALLIRLKGSLRIVDVPNERSSHRTPKPRTGGIALAAGVLGGIAVQHALGVGVRDFPERWVLGGAFAFFALGLCDDLIRLPARFRLASQVLVATGLALAGLRLRSLGLPGFEYVMLGGAASLGVTVFWLTGFINLFNFMDGVDGIAAGEAMAAGVLIFWLTGFPVALVISGAAMGFLFFNYEPSSIFMGDGGSYFLGSLLALLAVAGAGSRSHSAVPFPVFVMIFGAFVLDTSTTLLRRIIRGEDWMMAHRSHFYQQLTDLGWSHSEVTKLYAGMTTALGVSSFLYLQIGPDYQWALIALWLIVFGSFFRWILRRRWPAAR